MSLSKRWAWTHGFDTRRFRQFVWHRANTYEMVKSDASLSTMSSADCPPAALDFNCVICDFALRSYLRIILIRGAIEKFRICTPSRQVGEPATGDRRAKVSDSAPSLGPTYPSRVTASASLIPSAMPCEARASHARFASPRRMIPVVARVH